MQEAEGAVGHADPREPQASPPLIAQLSIADFLALFPELVQLVEDWLGLTATPEVLRRFAEAFRRLVRADLVRELEAARAAADTLIASLRAAGEIRERRLTSATTALGRLNAGAVIAADEVAQHAALIVLSEQAVSAIRDAMLPRVDPINGRGWNQGHGQDRIPSDRWIADNVPLVLGIHGWLYRADVALPERRGQDPAVDRAGELRGFPRIRPAHERARPGRGGHRNPGGGVGKGGPAPGFNPNGNPPLDAHDLPPGFPGPFHDLPELVEDGNRPGAKGKGRGAGGGKGRGHPRYEGG